MSTFATQGITSGWYIPLDEDDSGKADTEWKAELEAEWEMEDEDEDEDEARLEYPLLSLLPSGSGGATFLFFLGCMSPRSSSSQSSARYSSSGTRAVLVLVLAQAGVLLKAGSDRLWERRRVLALPRLFMAWRYSSGPHGPEDTDVAVGGGGGGCLDACTGEASSRGGASGAEGAAGKRCLGRTGRSGLMGSS